MSKTAHKTANRSAIKSAWNPPPTPRVKHVASSESWWVVGAAPSDRELFMEAAHQRAAHVWTNVAPHAMNPRRGEFA